MPTILIVEDEAIIAFLLGETLRGMGYDVCATEGTEAGAIAAAKSCKPDLMIIDENLDGGSGIAVVEEVLRLESPVQVATPRFTTEPVDLGGVRIPAGHMVFASVLAGGRDRVRFERSDSFDPGRSDLRHVAFGHGIHHCLGAPLARAEAVIALDRLLSRFPDLRMAVPVDELTWRPSVLMHGLFALPVLL